ncbi:hypothetical protein [Streptomyces humi]|uniref:hypothetical protein n=1 Tax=Streptomyces humi TaxID=1428620 RepID=UPI001160C02F|nr:hypothetical protein [Streptomyces humi]
MTHTRPRNADRLGFLLKGAFVGSGGQPPRETGRIAQRDLPIDAQVWNWTESVLFSGYGPGASSFR